MRSSESGRIGARSVFPNRATGTRGICTSKVRVNTSITSSNTGIRRSSDTKIFALYGRRSDGIPMRSSSFTSGPARSIWSPWLLITTTSIVGIRNISLGIASTSVRNATSWERGRRSRAPTDCDSASAITERRIGSGMSSFPFATKATPRARSQVFLTMACRRWPTERANGGRAWTLR